MKSCILTVAPHVRPWPENTSDIEQHWFEGGQFVMYMGPPLTIRDSYKLAMLGFESVAVVYTNPSGVKMHVIKLDLKHPLATSVAPGKIEGESP